MTRYVLRRFLMSLLTLLVLICLTFCMMHAIPGGPFTSDRGLSPSVEAALNKKYHLDKPVPLQLAYYLYDLTRGDLGVSYQYKGKRVGEFIASGFPVSGKLGALTVVFMLLASLPMGIYAALRNGRWQDMTVMAVATLGVTIPSFVIATMLMYVFSCRRSAWTAGKVTSSPCSPSEAIPSPFWSD